MFILILLQLITTVVLGKEWYITHNGFDNMICGSQEQPCQSLSHVINISQSEDIIYLDSVEGVNEQDFKLCGVELFNTNLTIEGLGYPRPSVSCFKNLIVKSDYILYEELNTSAPLMFHNLESVVSIKNVNLQNGYILSTNSVLSIENIHIFNTAIFLMDKTFFVQHLLSRTSQNNVFEHLLYGFELSRKGTCNHTHLSATEVTFHYIDLEMESVIPLNTIPKDGIQAICDKVFINIKKSYLADKIIYVFSISQLHFTMIEGIFEGTDQGQNIQGGVKLHYNCPPSILIKDSSFKNMKFFDLLYTMFSDQVEIKRSAVLLENFNFPDTKHSCKSHLSHPGHNYFPEILFMTNNFTENTGAISVTSFNNYLLSGIKLLILCCNFFYNQNVGDGGAIFIGYYADLSINIRNSTFTENKAGVRPFNAPVLLTNKSIMNLEPDEPAVQMYNILFGNVVKLAMEGNKDLKLIIGGSGGAVYTNGKAAITIEHCTFLGNDASATGGSIFVGEQNEMSVKFTNFSTLKALNGTAEGSIIASYAYHLTFYMCKFDIISTVQQSALFHFKSGYKNSVDILNIEIYCPVNSQLVLEEVTLDIKHEISQMKSQSRWRSFTSLLYICKPCEDGFYSLQAGFYQHEGHTFSSNYPHLTLFGLPPPAPPLPPSGVFLFEKSCHNVTHKDFKCMSCPYGGLCSNGIKAKANYWGHVTSNDMITFYECPKDYCCKTRRCESYNICAEGRTGVLCGRCIEGYSEAMFSLKCIPNSECNDTWMIIVLSVVSLFYALFLIFQDSIENAIYGVPFVPSSMQSTAKSAELIQEVALSSNMKQSNSEEGENNFDEGGTFLILLFYYFQDASLIQLKPMYMDSDEDIVSVLKTIIGGIFEFQLNVLQFASNVCIFQDVTPVVKILLKLGFLPPIFLYLTAFHVIMKITLKMCHSSSKFLKQISNQIPVAVMLAILFSFQKLATSLFSLIYCVSFDGKSVLFLDGNIECYNLGQYLVFMIIVLIVFPFTLYLCFCPCYMEEGILSTRSFMIGCLFPFPISIYLVCKLRKKKTQIALPDDTNAVKKQPILIYNLLQGPYKNLTMSLRNKKLHLCYSGILLVKRLIFTIIYTNIQRVISKMILFLLLSVASFGFNCVVRPCKERRSNMAAIVSDFLLVVICVINLVRAIFIATEYIPAGPVLSISNALDLVEDCLLFWIPMMGVGFIFVIILFRLLAKIVLAKQKAS